MAARTRCPPRGRPRGRRPAQEEGDEAQQHDLSRAEALRLAGGAGQARAGKAGQGKARQGKAGQGKAYESGKAGKAGQAGKARQERTARQARQARKAAIAGYMRRSTRLPDRAREAAAEAGGQQHPPRPGAGLLSAPPE